MPITVSDEDLELVRVGAILAIEMEQIASMVPDSLKRQVVENPSEENLTKVAEHVMRYAMNGTSMINVSKQTLGLIALVSTIDWVTGTTSESKIKEFEKLREMGKKFISTPLGQEWLKETKSDSAVTVRIDPNVMGDLNLRECNVDIVE